MRRLLIAFTMLAFAAPAANAQSGGVDARVDRIEREIRALQRRVFPGGSSEFFEPEIQAGQTTGATGTPATSPITGLTDRVNSLESQLQSLTDQVEQNSFQLRQLQSRIDAMQADTTPTSTDDTVSDTTPDTDLPETDNATETSTPTATDITPEDTPQADTAGSEPPLPDDPAEASYVRGYRLWRDGSYEAARTQLRQTIEEYPGDRFESFARNLLGRAYLDDDKPANATEIFVRNYQELPRGDRAADSLFFLGVALTELEYNERACLAFDELQEVYGDNLRTTIARQVPDARTAAECN